MAADLDPSAPEVIPTPVAPVVPPCQCPLLEIACNSLASLDAALAGGADRIELCAALECGGITPSYAQIALARERTSLPLYVLIRPRGGDFLYLRSDIEAMLFDIEMCARLGCDGIVTGALTAAGDVDARLADRLLQAAGPLGVTFHRAFDVCRDPASALETLIELGYERILSSGQATTALAGAERLANWQQQARGRIRLMAGGGVRASELAALYRRSGLHEFHASASTRLDTRMQHQAEPGLGMVAGECQTQVDTVKALAGVLAELC